MGNWHHDQYRAPQHSAPHMQQGYPMQQQIIMVAPKSGTTAVVLELLPGFFFQWFGWGNIYAGNVGVGLMMMFGYWVLTAINFGLCFVVIGFITWPLTWLAFAILSSIMASNACSATNAQMASQMVRRY